MAKNAIIAVLSTCLVGMVGFILGQGTNDRRALEPLAASTQLPRRSTEQSILIDDAQRWPSGIPVREESVTKTFPGDHTISHKIIDPPILSWIGGNDVEVSFTGISLNEVNDRQNELLLLFKIQVRRGGFCAESLKRVFQRVLSQNGDFSWATDSSKDCGTHYVTLYDQWLAFVADTATREFEFSLPPTRGATPTGKMYVSVIDREIINVRLELDEIPRIKTSGPDVPL